MRYALGVEYDGTRYSGWQRLSSHGEPGPPTVQATLEDAVSSMASNHLELLGQVWPILARATVTARIRTCSA